MPTQNVNITTELEQFVKSQIKGGHFKNVSEVHRAALSQMARNEEKRELELTRLRQEIQVGLDEANKGKAVSFDGSHSIETMLNECFDEALATVKPQKSE